MSTIRSFTHKLAHPFKVGELFYDQITLLEPNVDALEVIEDLGLKDGDAPTVRQMKSLIAALARLDPAVIGNLQAVDFRPLGEAVVPLLTPTAGQGSPATPSTLSSPTSPIGLTPPIPPLASAP